MILVCLMKFFAVEFESFFEGRFACKKEAAKIRKLWQWLCVKF